MIRRIAAHAARIVIACAVTVGLSVAGAQQPTPGAKLIVDRAAGNAAAFAAACRGGADAIRQLVTASYHDLLRDRRDVHPQVDGPIAFQMLMQRCGQGSAGTAVPPRSGGTAAIVDKALKDPAFHTACAAGYDGVTRLVSSAIAQLRTEDRPVDGPHDGPAAGKIIGQKCRDGAMAR